MQVQTLRVLLGFLQPQAPCPLSPADHGDRRAVGLDEGQGPEEGHVELAVDGEVGAVVARTRRLEAIARRHRRVATGGLAATHVHAASGEEVLAWSGVYVGGERRACRAVEDRR